MNQIIESIFIITMAISMVYIMIHYRLRLPATPVNIYLLVGLLWIIITSGGVIDRSAAVWRMLIMSGCIAVYFSALIIPDRLIMRIIGSIGLITAVVSIVEVVITGSRASWLFDNPNITGGVLLLCSWYMYPLWIYILGMLATYSRGTLVAFGATVSGLELSRKPQYFVLAVALIFITVLIRPGTVMLRFGTWREAVQLFLDRPLMGWGPGSYHILAVNEPGHAHADNALLTIASETGIVGVAIFIAFVWRVYLVASRSQSPSRWALLATAIHQLVDCTIFWPQIGVLLSLSFALLIKENLNAKR